MQEYLGQLGTEILTETTETDRNRQKRTEMDRNGQKQTETDRNGQFSHV